MILSLNWLKDFVDVTDVDVKKFCDDMTHTGSKVEQFELLGEEIQNVKVGLIEKIEQHPDAERLVICQVNAGEKTIQIVTAAKNVFEGALVPVCYCPDGEKRVAKLAGGMEIKTGKLRGVLSEGMFCSIAELGLDLHDMPGAPTDGILILNDIVECKPGDDICDVLKMRDTAVEFEITPNRPDCLSVIGLAREAAVTFDRNLTIPAPVIKGAGGDLRDYVSVSIESDKCSRYCAKVVKNVKIAPSPLWMRMRLRAAGVRPINNIVDITNYVMIEYGQPMHAFDYACLDGSHITVRTAEDGEIFKTLDNTDRTLSSDMLVIADSKKPVGIAGVMGGANSEIKDDTATVVFESACFDGASVRITAKKLGMRTESSSRFEKGLDCENCMGAVERACQLVELLGAGEVVGGTIDVYPVKKPLATVAFEPEKINRFLGIFLSPDEMKKTLEKLEFKVEGSVITVPSFRDDVRCMNDVAEEVVRIYGYNNIASSSIVASMTQGGMSDSRVFREEMSDLLCGLGLNEIYSFSFIPARLYTKCGMAEDDVRRKSVEIANPFGEDTKTMRTTSIPSMLEVLDLNSSRNAKSASLYEMAKVFIPRENVVTNIHGLEGTLPDERIKISIGFYGAGDFFRMKGICEEILKKAGIKTAKYVANQSDPTFHPGRCADIVLGDTVLGTFGELHPVVAENYTFSCPVYVAELDLALIFENSSLEKEYTPLPKFPAVTRDFSLVCDEETEVGTLEETMRMGGVKILENITLFDVYRGSQLPTGKKSVSFSVTLRSPDHTLTVEEADKATKKILGALEHNLGVTIRS
ncbi:MAG: phenylalanine--tRNA ligase subunit beta [Clostridia bacterium]|nr:phenylalanine--tRNA ligase subunit beta [Clostridia bacterium]